MNKLIFALVSFLLCASLQAKPSTDNLLDEIARELKILANEGDVKDKRDPLASETQEDPEPSGGHDGPRPIIEKEASEGQGRPKPSQGQGKPKQEGPKEIGAQGPKTNSGPGESPKPNGAQNGGEETGFMEGLSGSNGSESPEHFDEPAGEGRTMGEMGDKIANMLGELSAHFSEKAKQMRENEAKLTPEVQKLAVSEERLERAAALFRELKGELVDVLHRISKAVSEYDRNPLEEEEAKVPEEEEPPQETTSPQQKRTYTRTLEKLLRNLNMK